MQYSYILLSTFVSLSVYPYIYMWAYLQIFTFEDETFSIY